MPFFFYYGVKPKKRHWAESTNQIGAFILLENQSGDTIGCNEQWLLFVKPNITLYDWSAIALLFTLDSPFIIYVLFLPASKMSGRGGGSHFVGRTNIINSTQHSDR